MRVIWLEANGAGCANISAGLYAGGNIAQINLAVHGLQGTIRAGNEAITYYKDPHELVGKCDFVMANPPFNVDEVDAEKVKGDKRLPFADPSGLRIGTPALTTRGLLEDDMREIAAVIGAALGDD